MSFHDKQADDLSIRDVALSNDTSPRAMPRVLADLIQC